MSLKTGADRLVGLCSIISLYQQPRLDASQWPNAAQGNSLTHRFVTAVLLVHVLLT